MVDEPVHYVLLTSVCATKQPYPTDSTYVGRPYCSDCNRVTA